MRVGKEGEGNREVLSIEVERVYAPEGNFSFYQFHARSIEDIEEVVVNLRERGLHYALPDPKDMILRPLLRTPKVNFNDYGFPVTVYLIGPSPEVEVQISEN